MIEYIENAEKHFIEVHIKDKITEQDMSEIWDKLNKRTKEWGKIKVLKKFDTFPSIELTALWQNITNGIKNINNFGSTAVVTDKQWIETLSKIMAPIAGKKVKCFHSNQLQEARDWLGSLPN